MRTPRWTVTPPGANAAARREVPLSAKDLASATLS